MFLKTFNREWSLRSQRNVHYWKVLFLGAVVTCTLTGYWFMKEPWFGDINDTLNGIYVKQECFQTVELTSGTNVNETTMYGSKLQNGRTQEGMKYIVYDCSSAISGNCGGWSDRMSGILSAFVISLLTERRFVINFEDPVPIHDYLVPANFDWRYNSSVLQKRSTSYRNFIDYKSKYITTYLSGRNDINAYLKEDIIFLRMNWDFTEKFRKRPYIGCEVPWITKLHYADIYKQMFYLFFKPSPLLASALTSFNRTQRKQPKVACAHLRFGANINMPYDEKRNHLPLGILWKYFDQLNKSEYDLFVASDTNGVKDLAKKRFPENMIDTPGKITHIDMPWPYRNNPREGFQKQLLDFYILVHCDILIITESGFGILASYVRQVETGLYCWRETYLRPCSRYTVNSMFPGQFLAPEV